VLRAAWNDVKSFFREAPVAFLLVAGLFATIFVAYQPASLIDKGWSRFEVFQRSILWLVRGTAFRSIVGPLALLVSYGALYYGLRIRGRRFIVVSDFRVWGDLEKETPAKGVAGRLQDELMRLLAEMRATESGLPPERARPVSGSNARTGSPQPKPPLFPGGGLSLPETQVTLQYEGISLEGLHTFIRRNTGREVVVTGDLFTHPNGVLLVARTRDDGPWEVLVESSDATSLGLGLQKLALRILTTLAQGFLPREANTFVFLQDKARFLEEHELGVRLAKLGLDSASDEYKVVAKENVAAAYNSKGVWLAKRNRFREAAREFESALEFAPNYGDAVENRADAYKELRKQKNQRKRG